MNVSQIKDAVRKRDGHCCTRCGMSNDQHIIEFGRSLEVHRLDPGSPYTLEGCTAVCKPCHARQPKTPHGYGSSPRGNGDRTFTVRAPLCPVLEVLAESLALTPVQLVNQAVRELLEKAGLWPPPQQPRQG